MNNIDSLQEQIGRHRITMWNGDILVLNDAVKDGYVGLMELLPPQMFIWFNSVGKGKYAIEVQ